MSSRALNRSPTMTMVVMESNPVAQFVPVHERSNQTHPEPNIHHHPHNIHHDVETTTTRYWPTRKEYPVSGHEDRSPTATTQWQPPSQSQSQQTQISTHPHPSRQHHSSLSSSSPERDNDQPMTPRLSSTTAAVPVSSPSSSSSSSRSNESGKDSFRNDGNSGESIVGRGGGGGEGEGEPSYGYRGDHRVSGGNMRSWEPRERDVLPVGSGSGSGNANTNTNTWSVHYRERAAVVVNGLEIAPLLDRLESLESAHTNNPEEADTTTAVHHIHEAILMDARNHYPEGFANGKAVTAMISGCARRNHSRLAHIVWKWCKNQGLVINTFHYNSMIAVAAADRKPQQALLLMKEMSERNIVKNEVTFSSAITACEKSGDWRTALDLLDTMEKEGLVRTPISYNAAISACEKGLMPQKACEVFQRMRKEGIRPSVVTYSALISAAEKGSQWQLALDVLEDMKFDGYHGNVIAYSAAISALAKGQQWEKALDLFREIQAYGKQPSIVTYNATMTALEKGLQWEKALDLFDEMKRLNLPITVVSYGSALSACDKGLQYRQCLEFLDEMTEMGIAKNVIIFGAAMSCMEKSCRSDICFLLMERMKIEKVHPNVHIYNSVISACARSNLWEKGYELFREMDQVHVKRDVVTFNAVLDAVASQVKLGRMLFVEGVKQGFYSRVSRLAKHWFELDLHFLSLGGGEIAMGWWFEVCLAPYLANNCEQLQDVKSISIVTGYGKTRTRGRRQGDDGMRKRCRAMLSFMGIKELEQANLGRLHIDMKSLIKTAQKNGGAIIFDLESYNGWKERETTVNQVPVVAQKLRPRYRPEHPGSARPPFVCITSESTSPEYNALDSPMSRPSNGTTEIMDGFHDREYLTSSYEDRRRCTWSSDRDNHHYRHNGSDREWMSKEPRGYQGSRDGFTSQGRYQGERNGFESRRSITWSAAPSTDRDFRGGDSRVHTEPQFRREDSYTYGKNGGDHAGGGVRAGLDRNDSYRNFRGDYDRDDRKRSYSDGRGYSFEHEDRRQRPKDYLGALA